MKVAAFLIALATVVRAQNGLDKTRPAITVYVERDVDDRCLNVSWAETIASRIFLDAGIHIKWSLGEPRRANSDFPILVRLTANTPEALLPGAFASAQVFEGVHIRISWDRIRNDLRGSGPLRTFLLAHVMAHEITHILQGVNRHSEVGLMKAAWTQAEIQQMAIKPLTFTSEDVLLIHNGMAKWATRRPRDTSIASDVPLRFPPE